MGLGRLGLALVGLLAYQNRDKIGDFLRRQVPPGQGGGGSGNVLDSVLSGSGLREVLDRFRGAGASEQVDSWVSRGDNQPPTREQIENAIDPATLDELSRQTGVSKEELIERIARDLPPAVDGLTPSGQLPADGPIPDGPNLLDDVPGAGGPSGKPG